MQRSYTTPLKTSSVAFEPTGVWRAVVTAVEGVQVWVRVPRLSGELEYGPLDVVLPNDAALPVVDDPVLVGFVEGRQDELVVLGVVKTQTPAGEQSVIRITATSAGLGVAQTLDTVVAASVRSVKYVVQATSASGYRVSEILVIHNGVDTWFSEYGVLSVGTDPVVAYDTSLAFGQLMLTVAPASPSVSYTLMRIAVPA